MKKTGFSLAELIITIGIIGLILTVMIRTTTSIRPNQEQIMLKKSYFELSRVIHEIINDDDFYPEQRNMELTGQYLANTGRIHYKGVDYEGNSKFCGLFGTKLQLRSSNECSADNANFDKGGHFTTADGIVWILPITTFSENQAEEGEDENIVSVPGTILIDVNGDSGENCYEDDTNCKNPDRFRINIHSDGRIEIPENQELTRYYITQTTTRDCAEKVREIIKKQKKDNENDSNSDN